MDFHDARTCVIFGAGDYYDETPAIPDDAFVVAADGGLDHARAFGIDADFVVGASIRLPATAPRKTTAPSHCLRKRTIPTCCRL
mgnify:FL=1